MTHVTRRLTAKNRDQLRNRTLGSRVRATFTFFNAIRLTKFVTDSTDPFGGDLVEVAL